MHLINCICDVLAFALILWPTNELISVPLAEGVARKNFRRGEGAKGGLVADEQKKRSSAARRTAEENFAFFVYFLMKTKRIENFSSIFLRNWSILTQFRKFLSVEMCRRSR